MKFKALGLLGLCKKSGNLTCGFDAVIKKVKKNKSGTIFVTNDFSSKSLSNLKEKLNNFNAQIIILKGITMQDIYCALGKKTGVILIENRGFAGAVQKEAFALGD